MSFTVEEVKMKSRTERPDVVVSSTNNTLADVIKLPTLPEPENKCEEFNIEAQLDKSLTDNLDSCDTRGDSCNIEDQNIQFEANCDIGGDSSNVRHKLFGNITKKINPVQKTPGSLGSYLIVGSIIATVASQLL